MMAEPNVTQTVHSIPYRSMPRVPSPLQTSDDSVDSSKYVVRETGDTWKPPCRSKLSDV